MQTHKYGTKLNQPTANGFHMHGHDSYEYKLGHLYTQSLYFQTASLSSQDCL